jgi:hypothetical protein
MLYYKMNQEDMYMKNNKIEKINSARNYIFLANLLFVLFVILFTCSDRAEAMKAGTITYTIKASDVPYKNQFKKGSTYNAKTKQYYLLRSYLEQLEKVGGGTLILSKGTYVITNTLYVPSNVTIILKDGVKLQKGNVTGTSKLLPSKSLIQLIAPSKSSKANVASKYFGETKITIIGEGTATIDLKYVTDTVGIVIGHNSNITIKGITFQQMSGGNFIKIGESKEVNIIDNVFQDHKDSKNNSKEAVELEIPDSITEAFPYTWSKNDKTINQDITIDGNEFYKLERAIGSTKYSENIYHKNVSIVNNTISQMDSHGIRVLNWEKCILSRNHFFQISNQEGSLKAILISGGKYPTVSNNIFSKIDRPIQIMPWKNNNYGSKYGITYNLLSEENKADMLNNTLIDMGEYCIRYNKTYNEFTLNTEKWEIFDSSVKDFTISPSTDTFQNKFMNYSTYNSKTKQYYVLRSYLEQLEKVGGGTLTLKAGTYEISNSLYVPSHLTIYFDNGVIIKKIQDTGINEMKGARSIFQLIAPSKAIIEGVYGGYEGEKDIQLKGNGTVIFDMNFIQDGIGIILGHNTDVLISGITFQNMYSGHFIELDASYNVTIENNTFAHHKSSESGIKEAINIDTPDRNTDGFHEIWTKYDATPNKDIVIQNNYFNDLERSIGTHKYSEGKYHENVQILNNKITNTTSDAIRIINWLKPVIQGNVIETVVGGEGTYRAILASGLIHPIITANTFMDVARPIQIMPWKNSGSGSQYEITYNEISKEDIALMLKNKLVDVGEHFIRVNKSYNIFDSNTDKYYYSY